MMSTQPRILQGVNGQSEPHNSAQATLLWRIMATVAVALGYLLAALLSLDLLTQPDGVAVFWPAAGLSAGVLIKVGPVARIPVVVGTIAATIVADVSGDRNIWSAIIFGVCNAGEAVLVASLIERMFPSPFKLDTLSRVLGLVVVATMASAISGVGGTLGFLFFHSPAGSPLTIWWHWFASDAIGIIAVAPLLIELPSLVTDNSIRRGEWLEGVLALIILTTVSWFVIQLQNDVWTGEMAVVAVFPFLLWIAVRCRPGFAAAAVFVCSISIVWTTTFGIGFFGDPSLPIVERALPAQASILAVALCELILAALFAERRQHEVVLQEALATGAVVAFEWDVATDLVRRSNNAAQVLGLDTQQRLSGASFLSRVQPDDLARMKALWSGLNRDNSTCSITYRFLRLDGRKIWLRGTMKAEFDAAGRLMRLKGLTRDITERKQANMRIAADLDVMKRLHRVGIECARNENKLNHCLDEILEAAIAIVSANKGNIQLFDQLSGTLTIAAQRGFEEPFLKYFGRVSDTKSACGAALQSGERVLVEDVTQSEIFIGRPSLDVLLEAGVHAIISVPLISRSRRILGMLSTHFSSPHRPGERELQLLDLLSRQAADYLERRSADDRQKVLMADLRDSEDRMRAIVNTAQNGIITIDDKGTIENFNPAAARIFGYSMEEVVGGNVSMLMPEPGRGEHDNYLKQYLDTGRAKVIGIERELTGLRRNGSTFPMELTVSEIAMAGRRMFVGVVHDITNRMLNSERQTMLMAELDHRVKNVLARVAMLAANTRKGSTSVDGYVRALNGRIQSMAAAHSLLSQNRWQDVGLGALVGKQLAPYATDSNVTIKGEDVMLGAAEIQAMAMVLHELVTNAAKYGSLSVPNGRVCVAWQRQSSDAGAKLVFEWRELGAPSVAAAVPSGYGTNLIRDLIPHELGGAVDLAFAPDGVNCKIEIPLEQK